MVTTGDIYLSFRQTQKGEDDGKVVATSWPKDNHPLISTGSCGKGPSDASGIGHVIWANGPEI